jgi:cytochrome oxidase Cu insertion factor (SCO1/SenC/PrrC family)
MVRGLSIARIALLACALSAGGAGAACARDGDSKPSGGGSAPAPVASSGADASKAKEGREVGDRAPDFEAKDVEGKTFKLSDYRGQVVVLDFWGFW